MVDENILSGLNVTSREFKEEELNAILSMLTKDERIVFDILKNSENALTALEVYDMYINDMINSEKKLNEKRERILHLLAEEFSMDRKTKLEDIPNVKRASEIKARFIRKVGLSVPTNRTVTRVLENLKDAGYVIKRDPRNKRARAYWALHPNMKVLLKVEKKMTVQEMKNQLLQIKRFLEQNKEE